jgi:TatA/E family protein of Tat protein translocase
MFGTLGGPELLLILIIALIVFGPKKLPEIGKSMGKMLFEFRKASTDFQRTIEQEVEAERARDAAAQTAPPAAPPVAPPPEPPALPVPASETVSREAAAPTPPPPIEPK